MTDKSCADERGLMRPPFVLLSLLCSGFNCEMGLAHISRIVVQYTIIARYIITA